MIGKIIEARKLKPGHNTAYCRALINYVSSAHQEAQRRLFDEFGEIPYRTDLPEPLALGLDLARYTGGRGTTTEKVEFVGALVSGDATSWDKGVQEALRRLENASKKRKKAVRHVVISLRPGEEPSAEQVAEMAAILAREANCRDCAILFAKHRDTDNPHAHFVVVTVGRDGGTLPFGSIEPDLRGPQSELAVHRALAWIEHAQGWSSEKNRLFEVRDGHAVRREQSKETVETVRRTPANQHSTKFEQDSGFWSLQSLARAEVLPRLLDPQMDWQRLHRELAQQGLTIERRGNGGIVSDGRGQVKLSTIDRSISWTKLKTLPIGEFQPAIGSLHVAEFSPRVHDPEKAKRYVALRKKRADASAKIDYEISCLRARKIAICEQLTSQSLASAGHLNRLGARFAKEMLGPALALVNDVLQQRIAALQSLRRSLDAQLTSLAPSDIDFDSLGETTTGLFDGSPFPSGDTTEPVEVPGYAAAPRGEFCAYCRNDDHARRSPLLIDVGPLVIFNRLDEETIELALIVAAAKWGTVRAYGDAHAVAQIAQVAKRLGIDIQRAASVEQAPPRHTSAPNRWAHVNVRDCEVAPLKVETRDMPNQLVVPDQQNIGAKAEQPLEGGRSCRPMPPGSGLQF